MLVKRTNILFDDIRWKKLTELSKKKGESVGALVRAAVDGYYKLQDDKLKVIQEACSSIEKKRKKFKGKIDYKSLIEYGRKI